MQTVTRAAFIAELRTWIGSPYKHQGRLKGVGVDCIGLVIGVAQACGITDYDISNYDRRPDGSLRPVMDSMLEIVPVPDAQPGDVLLFQFAACPMHVGIISGPDLLTHAYAINRKVVEHRIDENWRAMITRAYHLPGVV
jgi:NlpC/P60 family putative phage cell wall peptidase